MKAINFEIIRNLDTSLCYNDILCFFKVLKLTFSTDELVNDILKCSYSSFYYFNQRAKHGIILSGKVYKRLLKLYTYNKSGVWDNVG